LKGKTEMIGGDGEVLKDAIEITTPISLSELGAPLVDGEGHVIGVVSSACKSSDVRSAANCRTVAFGVPMSVIRQFLRSAPAAAARPAPWLGVQGVRTNAQVTGVRVTSVLSGSPAAAANMRAGRNAAATGTGPGAGADTGGDVIVALDGVPIQSTEMLADLVRTKMVGDKVQLIVVRAGRFQVIEAVLTPAPQAGGSGTGGSAGAGAGAQPPPAP
ncbi:MAG: PDZ domain-containing protein, partial [Polyangiaceae bacterium]|nr:PDZ domain-containing protein [Polyangiaceae bacterium]